MICDSGGFGLGAAVVVGRGIAWVVALGMRLVSALAAADVLRLVRDVLDDDGRHGHSCWRHVPGAGLRLDGRASLVLVDSARQEATCLHFLAFAARRRARLERALVVAELPVCILSLLGTTTLRRILAFELLRHGVGGSGASGRSEVGIAGLRDGELILPLALEKEASAVQLPLHELRLGSDRGALGSHEGRMDVKVGKERRGRYLLG